MMLLAPELRYQLHIYRGRPQDEHLAKTYRALADLYNLYGSEHEAELLNALAREIENYWEAYKLQSRTALLRADAHLKDLYSQAGASEALGIHSVAYQKFMEYWMD